MHAWNIQCGSASTITVADAFWRRFAARNGVDLLDEIQSLMRGFGSKFTINFA
jgi:hypothetical protein